MNAKITFQDLAALLASFSGMNRKICEDFLREFSSVVSNTLADGESVKIKGFGTFKLVEIDERKSVNVATGKEMRIPVHTRVSFVPSKELANSVNAPFSVFESVEISDGIPDSEIDNIKDNTAGTISSDTCTVNSGKDVETADDNSEDIPDRQENIGNGEDISEEKEDGNPTDELAPETDVCPEDTNDGKIQHRPVKNRKFGWGFLAGFLSAAAIIAIVLFAGNRYFDWLKLQNENKVIIATARKLPIPVETDTVETHVASMSRVAETDPEVNTQPSDNPVYDTISRTRYLTTMAKQHYGNYHLWPYIYEENKAILGHPDRIRPGTRVVIPKLSKYGIDPNNKDDIENAKKKGSGIYARYK